MDRNRFKIIWESGGATLDECYECAVEWGLFPHPELVPTGFLCRRVVEEAGACY